MAATAAAAAAAATAAAAAAAASARGPPAPLRRGRGGGDEAACRHFACGLPPAVASWHRGLKTVNWRQRVWPPALGELVLGVTRRPLGAEEAPVRRLRAPDKSGAGASSAVSMEERETEEVGGRSSRKNTATVSAASLPPCIGVKSCRCRRCSCRRCLLLLLAPGKDFPAGGTMCGVGSRS
ncbi:PH domain leucine-rich repeat-containing protein phosphatase 1-like [Leopardus geoffroyi]|uniref:PH domain leucine-rich repeat-containing protein phosphatase 1-like n=1 Tax=Leopardus geoffroyi TaxID=46844 RepID=UPI001E25F90D|nr:PH domain leucine-rich repeat-containing protein phosphatase 1-like [Leopardus geoffroyi]